MLNVDDVLRELAAIGRQRVVVEKSLCSDSMKERLLAQLKAKESALEAELKPVEAPKRA